MVWRLGYRMIYVCNQIYLLLLRNHTSSRIKRPMKQRRLVCLKEYYLTMECNLFEAFVWFDSEKRRTGVSLANLIFFITSFRRIIFQFRLFCATPNFLAATLIDWWKVRRSSKTNFIKDFFFILDSKIHNTQFYQLSILFSFIFDLLVVFHNLHFFYNI